MKNFDENQVENIFSFAEVFLKLKKFRPQQQLGLTKIGG